MTTRYPSSESIKVLHRFLINTFGGYHGIRDEKALESAIMRPQTGYYDNLLQEAAALMESLGINHPFIDGNKRIAFFTTDAFLRLNGKKVVCDDLEAYEFIIGLFESNSYSFEPLQDWLQEHVQDI